MNQADLELSIAGKRAEPLTASYLRDLDDADLLTRDLPKQTKPVPIKKIRANHRQLAKYVASGIKQSEAAILCGLTDSRVSILMGDPMFKQLVGMYAKEIDDQFVTMNAKMATLGEDVLDNISEKFEDDPDSFSLSDQMALLKMTADRTGNGPATSAPSVNVNIGIAERMESARLRVDANRMRDVTPSKEAAE